jgi:ABC-type branched-subunit amino acid transport system ATPase component
MKMYRKSVLGLSVIALTTALFSGAAVAYVLKVGAIAYSGSAPGLINDPEVFASYLGG